MVDSFSLRWFVKRLLHVMRSRIYFIFIVVAIVFFLITYSLESLDETFYAAFQTCNNSHILWKEVSVPGQIRTVITSSNLTYSPKARTKLILLWTTYFSEEYSEDFYFFQKGRTTFEKYNCEFCDCEITSNKSLLPEADAVLFHARDLKGVPKRVRTDQIWILYNMEPPQYAILKWRLIRSRFNWTMTYRSDSQVQVKYGIVVRRDQTCETSSDDLTRKQRNLETSSDDLTRKKRNLETSSDDLTRKKRNLETSSDDLTRKKKNAALWLVSNCRTQSKREAYVKELRRHFPVDVFGKCSRRNRCDPPQSEACYRRLLGNYKFYLSFENSICKDYVTEKFFNALAYDTVPVVLGGADYPSLAPPGSLVDAGQFPDPRALAQRLKAIAANDSWYRSFSAWKGRYAVHLHPWMCDLCERLHHVNRTVLVHMDFWSWWVPGAKCRVWDKSKGFRNIF